jgi:hypothetical protein
VRIVTQTEPDRAPLRAIEELDAKKYTDSARIRPKAQGLGQLVMELYGHPSDAGARARNLAVWDGEVEPLREIKAATG